MRFHELKKAVQNGQPEVYILANQRDLYLVKVINEGGQSLLTKKHSNRPLVFRSLQACYQKLSHAGLHRALVEQSMAFDEMINLAGGIMTRVDHRPVYF
ncbi:MAG: hypothetical protein ACI9EX_001171 [Oleispira sp.]|jgi:hypothetical protein